MTQTDAKLRAKSTIGELGDSLSSLPSAWLLRGPQSGLELWAWRDLDVLAPALAACHIWIFQVAAALRQPWGEARHERR